MRNPQKLKRLPRPGNAHLVRVDGQTQRRKLPVKLLLPMQKLLPAGRKKQDIIGIPQVQNFFFLKKAIHFRQI